MRTHAARQSYGDRGDQRGDPSQSDGVTCFVKGFDNSMSEDDVREALTSAFAPYGEVIDIRLPFDRFNQCLKGFGYVVFAEANGATVRTALCLL